MTVMLMPSVSILLVVSSAVVGKDTRAMAGSAEVYYPHLFIQFSQAYLLQHITFLFAHSHVIDC